MNIDSFLDLVLLIGLSLFIISTGFTVVRIIMRQGWGAAWERVRKPLFWWPLLVLVPLFLISQSIIFIPPQQMGVVVSALSPKGYRDQRLESGVHFIVPLLERVELYPRLTRTYTLSRNPLEGEAMGDNAITARTADGQEIAIDVSMIYRLDPYQVVQLHIAWQDRYERDLIRPLLQGLVRRTVASFTVDEVNSIKRQTLEATITQELSAVLSEQGIVLEQFLLRQIEFSPEYAASVEQKQVALQRAVQREYEAEQIRVLAEGEAARVLRMAQAEAEALTLIAAVLKDNPDLLTYQYIAKIASNIRVMLLPSNAPLILPLDQTTVGLDDATPTSAPVPTSTPVSSSVATP